MCKEFNVPLSAPESCLVVDTDHEGWGRVFALSFPGLRIGYNGSTYVDPADLKKVMSALRNERTSTIVVLVENPELPEGALPLVTEAAKASEILTLCLPVADFSAPDAMAAATWQAIYPALESDLMQGRAIAFVCLSGIGRSPSFVARVLIQTGLDPDDAVARVRGVKAEAIENEEQMNWARNAQAGKGDEDADGQT